MTLFIQILDFSHQPYFLTRGACPEPKLCFLLHWNYSLSFSGFLPTIFFLFPCLQIQMGDLPAHNVQFCKIPVCTAPFSLHVLKALYDDCRRIYVELILSHLCTNALLQSCLPLCWLSFQEVLMIHKLIVLLLAVFKMRKPSSIPSLT